MEFKFKQFSLRQDITPMKVGTDSVLLGAWADIPSDCVSVLDIGTGTGILALMLAQRNCNIQVDAIDVSKEAVEEASLNVQNSPFAKRVKVQHKSLQDFLPTKVYDMIISNPPYFVNSLKSPDEGRAIARNTDSLPLNLLISKCAALLRERGMVALVLPYSMLQELRAEAVSNLLSIIKITYIRTIEGGEIKRVLVCLQKGGDFAYPLEDDLVIKTSANEYTPQYRELTNDFYISFN